MEGDRRCRRGGEGWPACPPWQHPWRAGRSAWPPQETSQVISSFIRRLNQRVSPRRNPSPGGGLVCGLGAGRPPPVLLWLSCSEGPPGSIPPHLQPPAPPEPPPWSPEGRHGCHRPGAAGFPGCSFPHLPPGLHRVLRGHHLESGTAEQKFTSHKLAVSRGMGE